MNLIFLTKYVRNQTVRWLPRSNHDHLLELALHGPQPQQIHLEAFRSRLHLQALHATDRLQQADPYQLVEPSALALWLARSVCCRYW
jgi:hypothetical protein